MFIKFNFRKSLFYLAIYRIIYYVRLTVLMLMKSRTNFDNPTIITFLMSLGEIIGGLSVFFFVRRILKKKKMNFLREKLLRDREKKIRKDRWTKRILLIFFSSFFDFIEFNILNDFFLNSEDISISINVRYSAVATISSTLLCVYGLNFKIGRHQLFSMIGIAIFLILQYLIELSFSSNYLVCLQVFLLNILHLVLITFSDVIERYLADINFPNPFCILFGEGIFIFILNSIYVFFTSEKNPFIELYNLSKEIKTGKFILLLFFLLVYILLSCVYNVYKVYCNVYLSPMAKSLVDYLFNPIYLIFSFLLSNDFLYKQESSFLFFILNETIAFIFTFLGFVYYGYIILYCFKLQIDTTYDISIRAVESLKDDKLDDIKEKILINDYENSEDEDG